MTHTRYLLVLTGRQTVEQQIFKLDIFSLSTRQANFLQEFHLNKAYGLPQSSLLNKPQQVQVRRDSKSSVLVKFYLLNLLSLIVLVFHSLCLFLIASRKILLHLLSSFSQSARKYNLSCSIGNDQNPINRIKKAPVKYRDMWNVLQFCVTAVLTANIKYDFLQIITFETKNLTIQQVFNSMVDEIHA